MIYHVLSKSIAGFTILNNEHEMKRLLNTLLYYSIAKIKQCFSTFYAGLVIHDKAIQNEILNLQQEKGTLVNVLAYCLMPTHFHAVLETDEYKKIPKSMGNVLNSYSRFFNILHGRKGPLWEGRFSKIIVSSDEQLLHLTRYIHLNPVTAYLCDKPEKWQFSSYKEYILPTEINPICSFRHVLDISAKTYKKFVESRINYQRELAKIKKLTLE